MVEQPETPTTAEERAERRAFWATIPQHSPPLVGDFERRLLADLERANDQLARMREDVGRKLKAITMYGGPMICTVCNAHGDNHTSECAMQDVVRLASEARAILAETHESKEEPT